MANRISVAETFCKSQYSAFVAFCHDCCVYFLDELTPVIFVAFKSKNNLTTEVIRELKDVVSVKVVTEAKEKAKKWPTSVPWDEEETVLLVDLYFQTKDMNIIQQESCIAAFAEALKMRTAFYGKVGQDSKYSIAEIKKKLHTMYNLMTNKNKMVELTDCSKLEKRILGMYLHDQDLFALKLNEAQVKMVSITPIEESETTTSPFLTKINDTQDNMSCNHINRESYVSSKLESYMPKIENNIFDKQDTSDLYLPEKLSQDDPIAALRMSGRSRNALKRAKITSVGMMMNLDEESIKKIRGAGEKIVNEILSYQEAIDNNKLLENKNANIFKDDLTSQAISVNMRRILDDYVLRGFYNEDDIKALNEKDAKLFLNIRLAREALGERLSLDAYTHQACVISLQNAISEFLLKIKRLEELWDAFRLISILRKEHSLSSYLLSFSSMQNRNSFAEIESSLASLKTVGEISLIFDSVAVNETSTNSLLYLLKVLSGDIRLRIKSAFDIVLNNTKNERAEYAFRQRCKGLTLQEIANEMGLTRERVRQLSNKIINALTKRLREMDIDIIKFISAEHNSSQVLTTTEIRKYLHDLYCVDMFLYVARGSGISNTFQFYNELDAFSNNDLYKHLVSYRKIVQKLPRMIEQENRDDILFNLCCSTGLPFEVLKFGFDKTYKLSGNIYHRGRLTLTQIYNYVLEHYYPAGMKLYDSDEMLRFRKKVANAFGDIELPTNSRAIDARISDIAVLCDRGACIHPNHIMIEQSLIDEIRSYIKDSTRVVFSFNELYEYFKDKLFLKSNVNNRYFLQGVIKYYLGDQYYFTRDTISKDESVDLMAEIEGFVLEKGEVHKSKIFAAFMGITEVMLAMKAANNKNIISIDNGWYMHANQLCIEPKDYCIKEIIDQQTKVHPVSIRKLLEILWLSFPEFLVCNNINSHGKLFGVLKYLFDGDFDFSRPYIAQRGTEELSNILVVKQHLKSYESIAISDLIGLCNEHKLRFLSTRTLIIDLNDEFLRTDAETLSRNDVGIDMEDVSKIAALMMERINNKGYLVASMIENYIFYPDVGFDWNPFLLRSYVEKYFNDSIGIIDIPTTDTYAMNSIFVDPALDMENYESMLRIILKSEHNNEPFASIVDVISWLREEGLILGEPPKCLLGDSIISVGNNGKLTVE